jgi:hypothetical protein
VAVQTTASRVDAVTQRCGALEDAGVVVRLFRAAVRFLGGIHLAEFVVEQFGVVVVGVGRWEEVVVRMMDDGLQRDFELTWKYPDKRIKKKVQNMYHSLAKNYFFSPFFKRLDRENCNC